MYKKLLAALSLLLLSSTTAFGQLVFDVGGPITTSGSHTIDVDVSGAASLNYNTFKFTLVASDPGVTFTSVVTAGTLSDGMTFKPTTGQLPTPQGGSLTTDAITVDGTVVKITINIDPSVTNATVTLTDVLFKFGSTTHPITPTVPTLNITVGANSPPVATNDTGTVVVASSTTGNVLTNDTDADSDPLTATLATAATNGTATVSSNGDYTYTHNGSATTSDSFTYTVSDGNGGTDTGTVTITVTNQAPTASSVSQTTPFETAAAVTLAATDPESQTLTYSIVSNPSNGTLSSVSGSSVTYTPNGGFSGTDSFTYKANDGLNDSNTATVTMTVLEDNNVPVANADAATVVVGSSTSGNVLTNDTDADADPLTAALASNPANGTATVASNGAFTYTHDGSATTSDSFTYTVSDGNGGTATGTVTITVTNQSPTAVDVSATTPYQNSVTVTLSATDPEGQTLTYSVVASPTNGTVSAVSGSSVTYTPNGGFSGTDTFTYKASDGLNDSNNATVTITVEPPNNPPVANADSGAAVVGQSTSGNVLTNDTDADSDPLTATLGTAPSNGTATLASNGDFSYTHDGSATTSDAFTYTVSDGRGGSATGIVSISITNQAPTATDGTATTEYQQSVTVTLSATDPEGQTLSYAIVAGPSNGTLSAISGTSVTYTPNSTFSGSDTFTWKANDGLNDSNTATVTITVEEPNVAPSATDDTYSGTEDTALVVAAPGVLGNDTDANGDALQAAVETSPDNGTLTLAPDGSFTYTPNANFNGTDVFTYVAADAESTSSPATVTLTIAAVNDPPVADPKTADAIAGVPLEVTLSGSDTEGDALTFQLVVPPSNGSVTIDGAAATYTANVAYRGTDDFFYRANDGTDNSELAQVTLTVTGNFVPVAADDAYELEEEDILSISGPGLLANDTDGDGDDLTAVLVDDVQHGSLILNPNGGFFYEPVVDFSGTDTFTYSANDGLVNSAPATVTLTVTPTGNARVQIIHSAPDDELDPADVYLNGDLFLIGAAYRDATAFLDIVDGPLDIGVTSSGSTTAVASFSTTLAEDEAYVLVIAGTSSTGYELIEMPNALEATTSDRFEAFFAHAGPDLPTIDIVSVSDNLDEPLEVDLFNAARFGDTSPYLANTAGEHNVAVRTIGGSDIEVFRISASAGKTYAAVLSGLLSDSAYPVVVTLYDADGVADPADIVTSLEPSTDLVPRTFLLRGNYPNPFNPTTNIQFDLPEAADVAVKVTDLLGRVMLTVPEQPFSAGTNHFIPIDAAELASGIYIYRVEVRSARDMHVATGTMTLIK